MHYKKTTSSILTVVAILLLTGCAKDMEGKIVDNAAVVCEVIEKPLDKHVNSILDFGRPILSVGGSEVLVTATELSDVYEASCEKNK